MLSAAELLLQDLGVTEPEEIDLDAIAWHVGCEVRYRPLDGCEARIIGVGTRAIISVSTRSIPARRRFSLGHELGHWHYHRGRSFICRADDIGNYSRTTVDPERVADGYAADLLLPPYLIRRHLPPGARPTFKAIDALKDRFNTSTTATARRVIQMSLHPAILVAHRQNGRHWFERGPRVPSRWFPRDDLDADSYAFEVLFKETARSHRALMPAVAWFDRHEAERYEIYEETVRLSEGEILTILTLKDGGMMEGW